MRRPRMTERATVYRLSRFFRFLWENEKSTINHVLVGERQDFFTNLNVSMKKFLLFSAVTALMLALTSCGSKKVAQADEYYDNPKQRTVRPTRVAQQESRVEAAAKQYVNGKLRAFASSKDYDKTDARRDAIRSAQVELAMLIENGISQTVKEFRKKATANKKMMTEKEIEDHVESFVIQVIQNTRVVDSQAYDVSDGTVEYEVCVEIPSPVDNVIGEIGDNLSREGVLAVDYDKHQFIKENKEIIENNRARLYEKLGK